MSTIIALTGPPAAGKSVVCDLFEDVGVPTVSTGEGVRELAENEYDDPDEDDIWETAQELRDEHGPAGPTISCGWLIDKQVEVRDEPLVVVSDLRHQAEVDFLQDEYDTVLVVRVDTRNPSERTRRYVDREIGNLGDDEQADRDRARELRQELYERERRESPYPRHHVTLLNGADVRTPELMERVAGLASALDPDGEYDVL